MDDPAQSRIWRVEIRAHKKHLKDSWGVTTWDTLYEKLGDIMVRMVEDIRHCTPTNDTNRARWPMSPFWQEVLEVVRKDLQDYRSFSDPDQVKTVMEEEHKQMLRSLRLGLSVSLAGMHGVKTPEEFEAFLLAEAEIEKWDSKVHKIPLPKRLERALAKYVFLRKPENVGPDAE